MFSKEQQRIFGFPMSRVQKGLSALLEDMKRRGVPIPREFQEMSGMPAIAGTFQDFLQSESLQIQGGKRKTRKTRKGGSRGFLILKCLLFVTQYYVFGEVFRLGKQSIPSTNIVHVMNSRGLRFTTNAYIALLSGLMVSMMVNIAMIFDNFEKQPLIPENSGRVEELKEVRVNSNSPKAQGGAVLNLYERFQQQMAKVQAIPVDTFHAVLVRVLRNLQSSQTNLVAAIEASLGPMDRLIEKFSKPVGGTVGQLDTGMIQDGAMQGGVHGGVHGMVYAALFFILFVFGGGKQLFNAASEALVVGENRVVNIGIRRLYTIPWIGEAHLADSELYMLGVVGCFFFYAFLVGWLYNRFEGQRHEEGENEENENELPIPFGRPHAVPRLPQAPPMNLQMLIEELERIPDEEWTEEAENGMNRILATPGLPNTLRNAVTRKTRNVLLRRVNAINRNFTNGRVTRRKPVYSGTNDLIMREPVTQNMPMVNYQGELGFNRAYSWPHFKNYATSKVGLITNPVTKRRIRRGNLEPYMANMVNRKNGKNKTD